MTGLRRVENILARFPIPAAVLYGAVVVAFVVSTVQAALDIAAQRDASAGAADILAQLEGRNPARSRAISPAFVSVPTGSPFLEGATISVAGAALLQRVAAAITRVGGNLLSSQVDLQGAPSKPGFVTVTASGEIEPARLQPLLYDIEAGMPFLFIDQMVVQAPASSVNAQGGKLRVLLSVSGQWRGAK